MSCDFKRKAINSRFQQSRPEKSLFLHFIVFFFWRYQRNNVQQIKIIHQLCAQNLNLCMYAYLCNPFDCTSRMPCVLRRLRLKAIQLPGRHTSRICISICEFVCVAHRLFTKYNARQYAATYLYTCAYKNALRQDNGAVWRVKQSIHACTHVIT